ncbi:MAG: hypothetical protein DCC67_09300 [Planctomycetota bacterium]|nr:MAG: hypothetical protein DCC67_09300 [Planctomycetota bacterium]
MQIRPIEAVAFATSKANAAVLRSAGRAQGPPVLRYEAAGRTAGQDAFGRSLQSVTSLAELRALAPFPRRDEVTNPGTDPTYIIEPTGPFVSTSHD